jgi:hypothetical protein
MTPEQLLDNFKLQQSQVMEEIRKLDEELSQKKELYIKLQGAIEGLELLNPKEESSETSTEEVSILSEVLS